MGGGGEVADIRFCQKFPKHCMKLKINWAIGGHAPGAPTLDPPLIMYGD